MEDHEFLRESLDKEFIQDKPTETMKGEEMNSLEFLYMVMKEWCRSEEQYNPFWNDVLTFARKYHKEMVELEKKHDA